MLSVLPFSHIYEHTIAYVYLLAGVRVYVCHDAAELLRDLLDVRPSVMTAVPRIFDRVLAGVNGAAMKSGRIAGEARAVGAGDRPATCVRVNVRGRLRRRAALAVRASAQRIVLRKIRAKLGLDRLQYFVSGSAALHVDTAMTFLGLGIPIMQGLRIDRRRRRS